MRVTFQQPKATRLILDYKRVGYAGNTVVIWVNLKGKITWLILTNFRLLYGGGKMPTAHQPHENGAGLIFVM
jgi:hypothetical protein